MELLRACYAEDSKLSSAALELAEFSELTPAILQPSRRILPMVQESERMTNISTLLWVKVMIFKMIPRGFCGLYSSQ